MDACMLCRRSENSYHIGQRSGGNQFLWRGYKEARESPTGEPLMTLKQWTQILSSPKNTVRDEKDKVIYGFLEMVSDWNVNPVNTGHPGKAHGTDSWEDTTGAIFLGREFE